MTHCNDGIDTADVRENTETEAEGRQIIRRRFGRSIDDDTVAPKGIQIGLDNIDDQTVPEASGARLRLVSDEDAEQQVKSRLAAANASFDYGILKENKPKRSLVAANDNESDFKESESWPLMEQLNRTVFEPDAAKRCEFIGTVQYICGLVEEAGQDALGLSVHRAGKVATPDYDFARSESGKVIYANGQTLDRKGRTFNHKNGETDARRFDGPVRTSKGSLAVSNGFNVLHDDPFSQRRIDAQIALDDLAAVVGALWLPLLQACDKESFTEIAKGLGYKQPVVGSAFIKLALEVATRHLRALHSARSFQQYVAENPSLPVAARRYTRALTAQIAA